MIFQKVYEFVRGPLVQSDDVEPADLIFVLGGHRTRKVFGALLFSRGWGPRILMSTGDPPFIAHVLEKEATTSIPIEKTAWQKVHDCAQLKWPSTRQCFAYLDQREWQVEEIPVGLLGTLGEIKALAHWLKNHPLIQSVLIVSIGTHLLRVRMCCERLLPPDRIVRFIAVCLSREELATRGERSESEGLKRVLIEWSKVILYRLLFLGPLHR